MDPTLLILGVVVLGVGAAVTGAVILRRGAGAREPFTRPPAVEQTDAHGRSRIVDRWVYLALELSRVDGAIVEAEIAAIEGGLRDSAVGLEQEDAARIVHNALRATIRQAQIGVSLAEILKHADAGHRGWVIDQLTAVAAADGKINRDEQAFLERVRQELGV